MLDRMRQSLELSRDGIHVTDLVWPRKAYWQRVLPKPLTEDEIGFFVAGRAHHGVIESLMGGERERSRQVEGIYFTPDATLDGFPVEIKTSRARFEPAPSKRGKEYDHYLQQLTAYMALEGKSQGLLVVFYLGLSTSYGSVPRFRAFKVSMTTEELVRRRKELTARRKALEKAIRLRKPELVPLCPAWACPRCKYLDVCRPWVEDENRASSPESTNRRRSSSGRSGRTRSIEGGQGAAQGG